MKLIIDINKEDYEYIRENKGMHYTSTTKICEAIFDGVPLEEELKKIQEEIDDTRYSVHAGNDEFYVGVLWGIDTVNEILEKHIKEDKQ